MWSLSTTVDSRCAITMSVRPGGDRVDRLAHALLVEPVERRRRLVEQQDRRSGQQRPRDREALALAAREHDARLADGGVDAERVAVEHLAEVHRAQHALAVAHRMPRARPSRRLSPIVPASVGASCST